MTITSEISTEPYCATRPTSLRPRSTSITCSAHSLGSAKQFLGEPLVLGFVAAASASAGERSNGDVAIDDADHDLRRTAHQRHLGRPKVEHERAGIHHAQRAVELERRGVEVIRSRWPMTTWKMSPARMYSTHLRTESSNCALREVRFERQRHIASVRMSAMRKRVVESSTAARRAVNPAAGVGIALA